MGCIISICSSRRMLPEKQIWNSSVTVATQADFNTGLLCQICYCMVIDTCFIPCGHAYCCSKCAANLTHCDFCKHIILDKCRLYVMSSE